MTPNAKAIADELRREFKKQLVTLMTAAFGFVAALFWQTAIKDLIAAFVPAADTWQYEIIAAVAVTLIAVLAIFLISRYAKQN